MTDKTQQFVRRVHDMGGDTAGPAPDDVHDLTISRKRIDASRDALAGLPILLEQCSMTETEVAAFTIRDAMITPRAARTVG